MNLIDAIKSGRPFRRGMPHESMRNLNPWRTTHDLQFTSRSTTNFSAGGQVRLEAFVGEEKMLRLQLEDLTADDWEIQEKAVTITRTQFYEAVKAYQIVVWPYPAAELLAEKLGLEEP